MTFNFLHTGDWHIGKPFGRFSVEDAGVLRRARLEAIDRLAATARARGVAIVLVAGDVYDRPDIADRDMREPLARMRVYADIGWHIIPGNHDPAATGGIWQRVLRERLPDNVVLHLTSQPTALAQDCWLLPAPLVTRSVSHDPTSDWATMPTPEGAVRIGLAHGSVRGFGSDGAASVAIAADRDRTAGLAYLALGDWHGVKRISASVWYAGTPEPDGFLDNLPGHALSVSVQVGGAPVEVETVEIGQFRWIGRTVDGARPTDIAALEAEIAAFGADARHVLLEVTAGGRVSMAEDRRLAQRLDAVDAQVFHLSRRTEGLRPVPQGDDLSMLNDSGLRDIARDLARMAADPGEPQSAVAERALRRLFELAESAP